MSIFNQFSLTDQVSIVTGGATGLGESMALALAEAGSNIVIADKDLEKAKKTVENIKEKCNVQAIAIGTDVTSEVQVNQMVDLTMNTFGRIDVLINNAGISILKEVIHLEYEDWRRIIDVNLNSIFLVSKAVAKVMIKQQKGSIINISSMSGLIVNIPQFQTAYNTSKSGVIMLTKSLAVEWVDHNIRVNTIAPGYMKTELTEPYFAENGEMVRKWIELTPMKRPGDPKELGPAAVYLASDASSFVTGSVLSIDGGYTAI
ncbi:glucose 1-dehydrogenase [Bacillus sp. FJAT-50079]|uniref:SDR family NAD(P)-dependent oxidoreductase n=1 Tax=Bacillus sp. FJAT-50079 TaxID=2833577 RepID=UPI001BC93EBF|nr:glucose 1-dehydrogenase [Bacillus sp. FJAT-50079]MBS4208128.1 glucose 1-dehydrogenase [Bacillus sp. FJAT-50079]